MKVHNQGFRQGLRRGLLDFTLALALFWFGVFAFGGAHNRAHAIPLPARASATAEHPTASGVHAFGHAVRTEIRVLREARTDYSRTLVLLSVTFAALVALNLAFLRHLRRVYASPRRGVWRRD